MLHTLQHIDRNSCKDCSSSPTHLFPAPGSYGNQHPLPPPKNGMTKKGDHQVPIVSLTFIKKLDDTQMQTTDRSARIPMVYRVNPLAAPMPWNWLAEVVVECVASQGDNCCRTFLSGRFVPRVETTVWSCKNGEREGIGGKSRYREGLGQVSRQEMSAVERQKRWEVRRQRAKIKARCGETVTQLSRATTLHLH